MKLNIERLIWSLMLILLLTFVLVQLVGLALLSPIFPEDWAFLAGFLVFWLLANKLLFGYGQFIQTTELFLADDAIDEAGVRSKIRHPLEWLNSLALSSLLTVWLNELDKYRYTFYASYSVVALFTILTKFDLLGYNLIGNYLEGAFWGASVVAFLVLALDWVAHTYPADILAHVEQALAEPELAPPTESLS